MEIGLQFIFQNTHEGMSDAEMMRKETEIALLAEEVGMDFLLLPEHHFDPNYSMMPDNTQWLAYIAGKTNRIKIGTGAIIQRALEGSNVDLANEFTNMILTTTGYSAASRVITTSDQLLQQLTQIIR